MLEKYFENRREKKRRRKEEKKKKDIGLFREYFELIAETLVYVFFVMTFLLQSFVIPTGSMIDNLLIGDHLLVDKVAFSRSLGFLDGFMFPQTGIKRGMIVTFRAPHEMDKEYVKRVIALPGETIKIVKQQVFINGKPLKEDYKRHFTGTVFSIENGRRVKEEYYQGEDGSPGVTRTVISDEDDIPINYWYGDNFPLEYMNYDGVDPRFNLKKNYRRYFVDTDLGKAFQVPEGHYFCMGDNRDNSLDSRFWGPVPIDYITGKPWRIYWSYESSTEEYLTPGILHKIKDIFKTIINFFSRTRWSRTLMKID